MEGSEQNSQSILKKPESTLKTLTLTLTLSKVKDARDLHSGDALISYQFIRAKQTQYCSTTSVMDTKEEQPPGKQATLTCDVFLHKVKVQLNNNFEHKFE